MSAARTPAPRLAREQRIDEILAAARAVFCEKGYEQGAVAEIAQRIGVVEGTLYKYFVSKRELLLAVLEQWYGEMVGDYSVQLAQVQGARAQLQWLITRHLQSIHDTPLLCRLMFREVRGESDYQGSRLHQLNQQYTGLLLQVVTEGQARGEFVASVPPKLLRDMVYGAIEHHSWHYICGRGALRVAPLAAQITDLLCQGIATQGKTA